MILTPQLLCIEAQKFSALESSHPEPSLYGITDGKAIGTYLEQKFTFYLITNGYSFIRGNSASGIDLPSLGIDIKVTSIRQPQSSCPFRSARQKIYGLGYSLIIFVYDKIDHPMSRCATLQITDTVFVESSQTADFQMTKGLRDILMNQGNHDDLVGFMYEKNLPIDEIEINNLANEILRNPPQQGYLTISNALQWRLQYARVIEKAGNVEGVHAIYRG